MQTETRPVLAKAIEVTQAHLIIATQSRRFEIPWEKCSARLAQATASERGRAELSPSGYGIHWPLLDEDLAVGPLVRAADPTVAAFLR